MKHNTHRAVGLVEGVATVEETVLLLRFHINVDEPGFYPAHYRKQTICAYLSLLLISLWQRTCCRVMVSTVQQQFKYLITRCLL
jgi:hypothetical protein